MVRNIGEKREEMARKLAEAEENKKESNTFDTSEEEQQLSSDANDEKSNANIVGGSHNGPKIAAGKKGNNIKSCCFCFLYHNDIDNKDENHPEPENNDNQEIDKNKKINQYLDMMIDRIFGPKRPNRKFIIRRFLLASFMAMGLAIGLGVWLGGGNGGDGESAAGGSLGGHGASNAGGACENDDMCGALLPNNQVTDETKVYTVFFYTFIL